MIDDQKYKEIFKSWYLDWSEDNSKCPMCKKNIKKDCMRGHLRNRQCKEAIGMDYDEWDNLFKLWKKCNPKVKITNSNIHRISPEEQAVCDIMEVKGFRFIDKKIQYQVKSRSNFETSWIYGSVMSKSTIGRNLKAKYLRMRKSGLLKQIEVIFVIIIMFL